MEDVVEIETFEPALPQEIIDQLSEEELKMVVAQHIKAHPDCDKKTALKFCLPKGGNVLANALVKASTASGFGGNMEPDRVSTLVSSLRGISSENFRKHLQGLREENKE